jgi:ATP-dependent helicase/nuclease subunit B
LGVRWVIGRAGTGKTTRCVRDIRQEMARDPLGSPLLWITPEQSTFSAERLLLTGPPDARAAGTFRAQVLSFRRLAMLIGRELGLVESGGGRRLPGQLGEVARAVLLEEMVRRLRPSLLVFGTVAQRPGFIARLDRTLRELRQHGHSGASLREIAASDSPHDPLADSADRAPTDVTARKLLDLALLLDAWSELLDAPGNAHYPIDVERIMHGAALGMARASLVHDARVWVDGISGMSALEIRLLVALGLHARDVTITLLADPDAPALQYLRQMPPRQHPGADDDQEEIGLFARPERLFRRLTEAFGRHQVRVEGIVNLRENHRFRHPALQRIEAQLFDPAPDQPPALPAATQLVPAAATPPAATPPPAPLSARRSSKLRPPSNNLPLFDMRDDSAHADSLPAPSAHSPALPSAAPPAAPAVVRGGLEIWECSDPETEVRVVAQAIRQMVTAPPLPAEFAASPAASPGGLRYRQIGVIVPDMQTYQDALRRVFSEHEIPHFIDERRTIAHHPLVELVRSAIAILRSRWDREEILIYLKTRLAGVTPEETAWLENYVIEHGIDHLPWDREWRWVAPNELEEDARANLPASARERLARVNALRAKVWADLHDWIDAASPPRRAADAPAARDAADFPRALRALLQRLQVETQLTAWAEQSRREGGRAVELALLHEQAWREIDGVLAMLETMLAGLSRSLEEFERIVAAALESLTLGLIPPTVDQVLISSVTRSRVPELQAVFIIGAVEGQFPRVPEEDAILSDAQREAFNARAVEPIADGSGRQLLEMPFFDYVALTRAARLLVVSYPVADRQGRALGQSRYVARLRDLLADAHLPGPHAPALSERRFDAASRTDLDRISTRGDLLLALAAWARRQVDAGPSDRPSPLPPDSAMEQLYNRVMSTPDLRLRAAAVWRAVAGFPGEPRLDPHLAQRFYPPSQPLRMSVSQLERFAACPLQYFMEYTLGLRSRKELALDVMDLGVLYHRILEKVYRRILAEQVPWPHCGDGSLRSALEAEVDAAIEELHAELAQRTPGYEKMRARTKRTLGIILEADRRRACAGSLRPEGVEVYFGAGPQPRLDHGRIVSLPLFRVGTPASHTVQLNGKIDRIDRSEGGEEEVAVIDYKSTSQKRLDLYKVFYGLSLQLPVYALVMRRLAGQLPIAALYLGLGVKRDKLAYRGLSIAPDTDEFYQHFKPHGMIDGEFAYRLEHIDDTKRKARWYNFGLTEKNEPLARSEALSHEEFETVLAYTWWKIGELADALMAGAIGPAPYRGGKETPCTQCEYTSLCPFDRVSGAYRHVEPLKKADALARMKQTLTNPP